MRHQEQGHAELLDYGRLRSLPNLATLTVATTQPFSMGKGMLAKLRTLIFDRDPFRDPPTRAALPRLSSFYLHSFNHHLPAWMEGWPFKLLQLNSWFPLSNFRVSKLRCERLVLHLSMVGSAQDTTAAFLSFLAYVVSNLMRRGMGSRRVKFILSEHMTYIMSCSGL